MFSISRSEIPDVAQNSPLNRMAHLCDGVNNHFNLFLNEISRMFCLENIFWRILEARKNKSFKLRHSNPWKLNREEGSSNFHRPFLPIKQICYSKKMYIQVFSSLWKSPSPTSKKPKISKVAHSINWFSTKIRSWDWKPSIV